MTKGIRSFTNTTFANTLPQLGELGAIAFRREVMAQAMMAFDINVQSASTHYNHALKMARAADPEAVKTLGRAEDKKGGRKVQNPVTVVKTKSGEVVTAGLSRAKANELIIKAAAKKSVKLSILEDMPAAEVAIV